MLNLPPPDAKQLERFNRDRSSVVSAMSVVESLRRFADALRPATLGVIAQSLSPGLPIEHALAALQVQLDEALSETIAFNVAAKIAEAEEKERQKPIYDLAVRRFFELKNALPGMAIRAVGARKAHEAKIAKLVDAGLSKKEASDFAGESEEVAATDALAAARTECAALDAFLRSREVSLLPAGFLPALQRSTAGSRAPNRTLGENGE